MTSFLKNTPAAIILGAFTISAVILGTAFFSIHTEAATRNASITLKKDSNGLFTLTISDPDGITSFSLTPPNKLPYSGGLSGCPKSFRSVNVVFADPTDFTPAMKGQVDDCRGNSTEFDIAPPVDGFASGVVTGGSEPAPASVQKTTGSQAAQSKTPAGETKTTGAKKSLSQFSYPIEELGNCANEEACLAYCDDSANAKACFTFAKDHGFLTEEKSVRVEKILSIENGPGGCNSPSSCEAYCSDITHMDECISFAESYGVLDDRELDEAKKIHQYVKSGGKMPGGCTSKESCEAYCTDSDHIEECITFAEQAGFMPPEEREQARKFLELMKRGETPGGCKGKNECEQYCFEGDHIEECIAFAEKAGFASPEELEIMKKTGGKGPGGCKGKDACETYCQAHQEECFNWAREHGMLHEEDLARMRQGVQQFKEQISNMPPEAIQCFKETLGEENFNRMSNGQPIFDRTLEEKMNVCLSKINETFVQQLSGLPPEADECIKNAVGENTYNKMIAGEPIFENDTHEKMRACFEQLQEQFSGPGGCNSQEECTAYCAQNPDACANFQPPGGFGGHEGPPPGFESNQGAGFEDGFQGPEGCRTPQECMTYCQEHYDDPACAQFGAPRDGFDGFPGSSGIQEPREELYPEHFEGGLPPSSGTGAEFFSGLPPEVIACIGEDLIEAVTSGQIPSQSIQDKITACFTEIQTSQIQQQTQQQYQPPPEKTFPQDGSTGGPGGCQTEEECRAYCEAHPQECGFSEPPSTSSAPSLKSLLSNLFAPLLNLLDR